MDGSGPISSSGSNTSTAEGLQCALSSTLVATAKAQTYHWNVTGPNFGSLHALFEEIYTDLFAAQDHLAERLKAIGGHADGRPSGATALSVVEECDGRISATAMVERLADDHRVLGRSFVVLAEKAEAEGDLVTHDLAVERAEIHDKFAWMLSAHLAG